MLLSQNDVLRVKELVAIALKHNRSINYIVDKVLDAIAGIYRARPSNDDKELAFVVLKLGGPSLLNILCKANKLPSDSTAYRFGFWVLARVEVNSSPFSVCCIFH